MLDTCFSKIKRRQKKGKPNSLFCEHKDDDFTYERFFWVSNSSDSCSIIDNKISSGDHLNIGLMNLSPKNKHVNCKLSVDKGHIEFILDGSKEKVKEIEKTLRVMPIAPNQRPIPYHSNIELYLNNSKEFFEYVEIDFEDSEKTDCLVVKI